ncbi:hypothetical protein VNO77_34003 [Canavalia gladiata]|uniref:Uncharacterized protein n=1 Tax=Canavalia gladiata TaxID=3824 RepID=A0AAN9PY74_CANGL
MKISGPYLISDHHQFHIDWEEGNHPGSFVIKCEDERKFYFLAIEKVEWLAIVPDNLESGENLQGDKTWKDQLQLINVYTNAGVLHEAEEIFQALHIFWLSTQTLSCEAGPCMIRTMQSPRDHETGVRVIRDRSTSELAQELDTKRLLWLIGITSVANFGLLSLNIN